MHQLNQTCHQIKFNGKYLYITQAFETAFFNKQKTQIKLHKKWARKITFWQHSLMPMSLSGICFVSLFPLFQDKYFLNSSYIELIFYIFAVKFALLKIN